MISKPHLQRAGVRFFQSDEEEDEEDGEEPEAVISVPPVVKVDKECWTHEPEFDKYVFPRNNTNSVHNVRLVIYSKYKAKRLRND